jgi:hypothetical protein
MLTKTPYQIPKELIDQALASLPSDEFRHTVNAPIGNFFYDPWKIKEEYKGTVWEKLLSFLPDDIGEARIILLEPGKCYQVHADIDDRYHLNLAGTDSFLINLEDNKMYELSSDCYWYNMDAGIVHTAANFGRTTRVQLVVRQLLKNAQLENPIRVSIKFDNLTPDHARFIFDSNISPILNLNNKAGLINDFKYTTTNVSFNIESKIYEYFKTNLPENFRIEQ